ncbi:MAG: DUF3592 domain-containing protein [Saprospiraceae bacterium]
MSKKNSNTHQEKNRKISLSNPFVIFLSMFILPGLIIGLFSTFKTIQVQSWVEVEATIDSTFYQSKSFSKTHKIGKRRKRKSYTKTQARAKYTYRYEGKTYQADKIALWQGYSKDEQRNKGLKKMLEKANTVQAYVNPNDPQEAILVRSIHNGILFGYISAFSCFFVFGAFGGLIMKYPSFKFGVICLVLIVLLYAWYFGWGGVYLINYIEVLS